MPAPPILILASPAEAGRQIARADRGGEPSLLLLDWQEVLSRPPAVSGVSAIVCEADSRLRDRRGLLDLLRRAWPEAPLLAYRPEGETSGREEMWEPPFDAVLAAPLDAAHLRAVVAREIRHRNLARRHREAAGRIRVLTERLGSLTAIVRAAGAILDPRSTLQLVMGRLQEGLRADAWTLHLLGGNGADASVELIRGDASGVVRVERVEGNVGVPSRLLRDRRPLLQRDVPDTAEAAERGAEASSRPVLWVPLLARGRLIGAAELVAGERDGDERWGDEQVELAETVVDIASLAVESALLRERLEELSVTDPLTRLYNARYLNDCLRREIKRARRYRQSVAVIFLDVDEFKLVNDRYGHIAGSRALIEVGRVLSAKVRETDIVARYGGDEFTIVMAQTGSQEALILAERLRRGLEERVFLGSMGLAVHLTASFGVASFPEHGGSPEELISASDQAMYRVKQASRNGVDVASPPRERFAPEDAGAIRSRS